MEMEFVILSLTCFLFMTEPRVVVAQNECSVSRCGHHGPPIRFPFRLQDNQTQHCGYPGFDLSCTKDKHTMLILPANSMKLSIQPENSVKLLVKSIDYKSQVIHLHDSDNCLPKQILRLNLSSSPFQFASYMDNFTILNCSTSTKKRDDVILIPCLGGPGYQILAIYPYSRFYDFSPFSCLKISSVPYSLYIGSTLKLEWLEPTCGYCEANGRNCRLMNNGTGHQTECFWPKPTKDKSTYKSVAVVVILGSFLLVFVGVALYGAYTSDKIQKENQAKIEKFLDDYKALKATRFSYADIKIITDQFKHKLGQGAYGTVFKGKLSNDILVAVKILNLNSLKGNGEEFINEVGTIGRIHHINVVRLVGFCADGFRRALVYEFLPNESLEKFIFFGGDQKQSLGWQKLQDIALGIAKGIEYLHQGCDQRILHFDIKPHNILLDNNFNPKISDFGLAKLYSKNQSVVSMTAARGTMGYIAPEVLSRNFGNVSHKSDVYSFGMLLLEMVGGRKNINETAGNSSEVYFPQWAYNHLDQGEELLIRIEEESDAKIAKNLTIVGLYCIQWHPVDRPSIISAVQMLEKGDNITMPPNPFPSTGPSQKKAIMSKRPYQELDVISEAE